VVAVGSDGGAGVGAGVVVDDWDSDLPIIVLIIKTQVELL
jgi:hypothetical protein